MKASRVVPTMVIITVSVAVPAFAQSRAHGVDVAVQATMLRLSGGDATSAGVGGRLTFDMSRWTAIDAEVSVFPKDDFNLAPIHPALAGRLVYHRRRTDGFVGMKMGRRGDRIGVFAKARPGFTKLVGKGMVCSGEACALILPFPPIYRTEFAFDLGGVFEVYPSRRILVRFDLGDVMIRHRSTPPPCSSCTSHNLTSRLGAGVRF